MILLKYGLDRELVMTDQDSISLSIVTIAQYTQDMKTVKRVEANSLFIEIW
jgi:hypothetical protein